MLIVANIGGHTMKIHINNFVLSLWQNSVRSSGAGTNLKAGGGEPVQSKSGGTFLVVPLQCLAIEVQLAVLVSAFVMVSTVWSVSCLLFSYPRAQPFAKVVGTCPQCPMESAPLGRYPTAQKVVGSGQLRHMLVMPPRK